MGRPRADDPVAELSEREREILACVAEGLSNQGSAGRPVQSRNAPWKRTSRGPSRSSGWWPSTRTVGCSPLNGTSRTLQGGNRSRGGTPAVIEFRAGRTGSGCFVRVHASLVGGPKLSLILASPKAPAGLPGWVGRVQLLFVTGVPRSAGQASGETRGWKPRLSLHGADTARIPSSRSVPAWTYFEGA